MARAFACPWKYLVLFTLTTPPRRPPVTVGVDSGQPFPSYCNQPIKTARSRGTGKGVASPQTTILGGCSCGGQSDCSALRQYLGGWIDKGVYF